MTKWIDKKKVALFVDPEEYKLLDEQRWQMKKESVPQVILAMIAYCLNEIEKGKKID